jgi:hypothetical protein
MGKLPLRGTDGQFYLWFVFMLFVAIYSLPHSGQRLDWAADSCKPPPGARLTFEPNREG